MDDNFYPVGVFLVWLVLCVFIVSSVIFLNWFAGLVW